VCGRVLCGFGGVSRCVWDRLVWDWGNDGVCVCVCVCVWESLVPD